MPQLLVGDALLSRAEAALAVALPDALGVEFVDPADPLCGVAFTVGGLAVTPAATLHGAALAAALELAGYLAVLPTLTVAEHAVTHHIATQYLRPAGTGQRVTVVGELTRRTRSMAFLTVTARRDDGTTHAVQDPRLGDDRQVIAQSQITKSVVAS